MSTRATITGHHPAGGAAAAGPKQGDQVVFVTENGMTVMKPAKGEANPFERYAGVLGGFDTKDEVNA